MDFENKEVILPEITTAIGKPPNTKLEIFNAFEDLITRIMDSENKEAILPEITTAIGLARVVTALTLRQTGLLELHRHFNFNN